MKVKNLNFLETGVEGIYILDHVAFKDVFDEFGSIDWDKSTGKQKLREWAEKNLTQEILEQFDVDLPTVEEVFSQKTLNPSIKSNQFPLFQNSDNRMMLFHGIPTWWCTRSAADDALRLWSVDIDGTITSFKPACLLLGFVPVLRHV